MNAKRAKGQWGSQAPLHGNTRPHFMGTPGKKKVSSKPRTCEVRIYIPQYDLKGQSSYRWADGPYVTYSTPQPHMVMYSNITNLPIQLVIFRRVMSIIRTTLMLGIGREGVVGTRTLGGEPDCLLLVSITLTEG